MKLNSEFQPLWSGPNLSDFGIKAGGGWPMWWVRVVTFSHYGHAALVTGLDMDPDLPRVHVTEARPSGVIQRWCAVDEFRWSSGGPIKVTDLQRARIHDAAVSCLGKGYDWPSLWHFVPRFFGSKVGYSSDHPDRRLFCSELVVWAYKEAGIDLFPGRAPGDIAPGELEQFCPR